MARSSDPKEVSQAQDGTSSRKGMANLSTVRKYENGFMLYEDKEGHGERRSGASANFSSSHGPDAKAALAELEAKLFGVHRPSMQEQRVTENDWVPIKTGIPGAKFLKYGPKHLMDAEQNEPLYPPAENILEDCLRREAERVAQQENLVNRIVYDSVDADPSKGGED